MVSRDVHCGAVYRTARLLYIDVYVCARGGGDFEVILSRKFLRFYARGNILFS